MKKLNPKEIANLLALTPMQAGVLFHYLKEPKKDLYFNQLCLEIPGEIDRDYFKKAWDFVVKSNEALRTVFRWEKMETPYQVVLKTPTINLRYRDLSTLKAEEEKQTQWEKIKQDDRDHPFDLGDIAFRVLLCKASGQRHYILISNHHILYDGWSTGIILKEFFQAYEELKQGLKPLTPSAPAKPRLKEIIRWQQTRDREKQEKFWRNHLEGFETQPQLPIKRVGLTPGDLGERKVRIALSKEIKDRLDGFAREKRVTMAAVFYCAWAILMQKYCGTGDVVFGTVVSGRSVPIQGIEHMVGLLINTVPLRARTEPGETLHDFLLRIHRHLVDREPYENTPLVDILQSGTGKSGSGTGLFDTIIAIENYPLDSSLKEVKSHLSIDSYSMEETPHYDVTVAISHFDEIGIDFIYNNTLFAKKNILRLAQHFITLLKSIVDDFSCRVDETRMLPDEEKQEILCVFNNFEAKFENARTIPGLFQDQARAAPHGIAVVETDPLHRFPEKQLYLTYRELDHRSRHLAEYLQEKGVKPGGLVGIIMERSVEMIIGILGILKAGSGYVPLNPKAPQSRNCYILQECNVNVLFTAGRLEGVPGWAGETVSIDSPGIVNAKQEVPPTDSITCSPVHSFDLAYVIFTSGSTGQPKGVPIRHSNLCQLLHWGYRHLGIGPGERAVQNLSYYFDWSVWEIFITLTTGAGLYMVPEELLLEAEAYIDFIARHGITILHITPTQYGYMVNTNRPTPGLRYLFIGAEKLVYDLVEKSFAAVSPRCRVFNMYGPTEATIISAVLEIERKGYESFRELPGIPIGKPAGNVNLLILDRGRHLCGVNIVGELYIGGGGLSAGYLNNPELTAEKFIVPSATRNPFEKGFLDFPKLLFIHHSPLTIHHSPLYKTGDLASWQPDGNICFLGRLDHQVKIRGYRLELGEIESWLLKYGGIKQALVVAKADEKNGQYLCGYIISETRVSMLELKRYLGENLPEYMIPAYLMQLDKIPLTPNGKLDLKALPEPEVQADESHVAPRDEIERSLVEIWSKVLGIEGTKISIDDNFFRLGGHSLKAALLTARLHRELNVNIPLSEIFKPGGAHIRGMAVYIRGSELSASGRYAPVEVTEEKDYYELSSGQVRLYTLQQMDRVGTVYNIPSVWEVEGDIGREKLQSAFRRLIWRHESLRTSFHQVNDEPVQRVHDEVEFEIEYYEVEVEVKVKEKAVSFGQVLDASGEGRVLTKVFGSPEPFFQKGFWPPEAIIKSFIRPFDLSKAPLLRVGISSHPRRGPHNSQQEIRNILMVDIHHIISDGISMKILIDEFMDLYAGKELKPLKLRYKDFTAWQDSSRRRKALEQQEVYWLKRLAGELPVLDLPMDFPRPVVRGFAGKTLEFEIGAGETRELKSLAIEEDSTLYMVLLALFNVLLSKLGGQEEIVVGSPAAGRRHPELENIIGLFINTLVHRNYPRGEKRFNDFLEELKTQTLEALENQDYPFEKLVEKLAVHRDTSRNPLFDVMLALQNLDLAEIDIPGFNLKPYPYESKIAKFDLTFICTETGESLQITVEYATQLFKPGSIERFVRYFRKLVSEVIHDKAGRIGELEIISEEEKQEILGKFNHFEPKYETPRTIPGLFLDQVKQTPHRVALVGPSGALRGRGAAPIKVLNAFGEIQLSYGLLNEESHRLAYTLQEKGVRPGGLVGIIMERSVDMLIGILGILKAGSGYVPLNPKAPHNRNRYILEECRVNLLLTAGKLQGVPGWTGETIFVDRQEPGTGEIELKNAQPSDLAYVIFTSGSTGQPKGVPIRHDNFSPLLHWGYRHLGIGPGERAVQNLSYYFDWSVWEIFITLTRGASLYTVSEELALDAEAYIDFIEKHGITILHITPTQYGYLANTARQTTSLRYLFIGAEKLTYDLVEKSYSVVSSECRVFNMYGPTEATIISATLEIDRQEFERFKGMTSIPIGRPTGNLELSILDKYSRLCPVNIVGELYIGGDGLSSGYLNNPELTAEKFCLRRPGTFLKKGSWTSQNFLLFDKKLLQGVQGGGFLEKSPHGRRRLYRTGDLSRWVPGGYVEFLGRRDNQVKIRGYRIELGEIENQLLAHKQIKEAVVIARTAPGGDQYLCAYLVTGAGVSVSEVREYLSGVIPGYMVPSYFVEVEKIPLNPNGKVDWRLLPEPVAVSEGGATAPRDAVEKKLVEIWSEVLGIDLMSTTIGIDDNFFEMGGHSLKATLLASKINNVFKVGISLIEIFTKPSIRELSVLIKKEKREIHRESHISIEPVEKREYYRLSSMQARLYVLQRIEGGIGYNIPSLWVMEGEVNVKRFEDIFRSLIRRHESLRTSFHLVDGEPVQRVHDEVEFEIEEIHHALPLTKVFAGGSRGGSFFKKSPPWPPEAFIKSFIRPFDLSRAPLLRVGISSDSSREEIRNILMVDMHHIISDGTSVNVLIKDFITAFRGENLLPQRTRYKDFSAWQKHRKQDERIKRQGEYWMKQWEGEIPVLGLPIDYPRPLVQGFEGHTVAFALGEKETRSLETLAREQDVTLFMVLLGVYTVLLAKLSGQEDIVVGTPIAGRNQAELENILGMFVNTLALRNFPHGGKSFSEFLAEVKARTLEVYANQDYPFEGLVEKLTVRRDAGRNPLFDVMLALQNLDFPEIHIPGLTLKPYPFESNIAKFDLTFNCAVVGGRLHITAEYASKLFTKDTIERFITYFRELVSGVIADRERRIGDLEIITEGEKQEILGKFNNFEAKYETPRTIPGLFRDQVKQTPHRVALVGPKLQITKYNGALRGRGAATIKLLNAFGEIQLSYGLLNEESHRLAYTLQEKGVGPGGLVGIIMERSVDMLIGILGILKAGSGYVPLNPKAPHTRNKYILDECRVKLLLTAGKLHGVPGWAGETIFVDRQEPGTGEIELKDAQPSDLAYVIFTSGSTGQPKGVPIRHDNFSPLLHWGYRHLGIVPGERAVQNLSYYFDWSVWEIFITLTRGASLYMVSEELVLDAGAYIDFIEKHGITILHITPTQYGYLANTNRRTATLRYLFIGAEKLTYDLVEKSYGVVSSHCRVFNMYGPTEATIISAVLEIHRQEFENYKGLSSIPIGRPTANLELLILDRNWQLCPVNIVGELYIGGDGLSIGYLNNPELTAEKFDQDLWDYRDYRDEKNKNYQKLLQGVQGGGFLEKSPHGRRRLYRTGDLARWHSDGNIEFLGRGDFQVKIRGFRIELGEIENRLLEYTYIKEAAVIDRRWENRETYLCAYIVPGEGYEAGGGVKALKEFLSGVLPDYMIPSAYVVLERMPLNPNKKIDRQALPEPSNLGTGREYIPPRDETERKLSLLWAKILNSTSTGEPGIGVQTDFFEIGGHSLKVLNLVNAIEKEFRVKVEFQEIFQYPTLGGLAELVRRGETTRHREIRAQSEKEYYELSYTQRRMWLLNQLEPDSPAFNLGGRIVLEEEVKAAVIREVLAVLAERHESFRTCFKTIGGGPVQVLRPGVKIRLEEEDLAANTPAEIEKQRQQLLAQESKIPFDLEKAPLLRMKLVKSGAARYDLLFTMHHIISDGWSLEVLEREFLMLYESRKNGRECEMPVLRLGYKDYAVWHNRLLSEGTGLEEAKAFWKNQLSGEMVPLRLPYDHIQGDSNGSKGKPGSGYRMVIPEAVTRELHVLAREHRASLFMVLLSGFTRLWYEISGQTEILLGIPGAGRPHEDLESIIGLFVNTLILKNRVDPVETLHDLLDRIQKNLVQVLEHQDFPLELICKELKIKYPGIRVFFNMFTFGNAAKEDIGSRESNHIEEVQAVKFDLECYLSEYRNGVQIDTHYDRGLFRPVTIEKIMEKYQGILEGISMGRGGKIRKPKRKITIKGRAR